MFSSIQIKNSICQDINNTRPSRRWLFELIKYSCQISSSGEIYPPTPAMTNRWNNQICWIYEKHLCHGSHCRIIVKYDESSIISSCSAVSLSTIRHSNCNLIPGWPTLSHWNRLEFLRLVSNSEWDEMQYRRYFTCAIPAWGFFHPMVSGTWAMLKRKL